MSYKHSKEKLIGTLIKDIINIPIDIKKLDLPTNQIGLSNSVERILTRAGIKSVGDFINNGPNKLSIFRSIGEGKIREVGNAINNLADSDKSCATSFNRTSFIDAYKALFSPFAEKDLDILQRRYGYNNNKCETLEAIGNWFDITRERVRQILVKAKNRIKHPVRIIFLKSILESLDHVLLQYQGIVSINDIHKHDYFFSADKKQLWFLLNILTDIYKSQYNIISNCFLSNLNYGDTKKLSVKIRESILECKFPLNKNELINSIINKLGPLSIDYLSYHLLENDRIEIVDGKVLSPGKLTIPDRIKLVMQKTDKPLHFTEIAELYKDHFGNVGIKGEDIEHIVHTRITSSKDFIIVDRGTFMLREKYEYPENLEEIVEACIKILQDLKIITDTKYLIKTLKNNSIYIGCLNAYSLKNIINEHPHFVSYGKFEVGLKRLQNIYKEKSLGDLIYDFLINAQKPKHVEAIWKEILKTRGYPKYAIEQRLVDEQRFIRVYPGTFTVKEYIPAYKEKCKIITDCAKKLIQVEQKPISPETISQIKGINSNLVEHALLVNPHFEKLRSGFFVLNT